MYILEDILGQTVAEAKRLLPDHRIRVVKEDGKDYIITMDYRTNRVNVEIEKGKITRITGVG